MREITLLLQDSEGLEIPKEWSRSWDPCVHCVLQAQKEILTKPVRNVSLKPLKLLRWDERE